MPASASLLQRLRRSVLGAWFAAAYALTVLALALAPTPSAASGWTDGILLCSGAAVPGDGPSGAPAVPPGDLAHCKGCPHNPVLAAPPVVTAALVARSGRYCALVPQRSEGQFSIAATGLPPSRAPPGA